MMQTPAAAAAPPGEQRQDNATDAPANEKENDVKTMAGESNNTEPADKMDIDGESDAEGDADNAVGADAKADVDMDAEAESDAEADADEDADGDPDEDADENAGEDGEGKNQRSDRMSNELYTVVENTEEYLSSYKDPLDGYQVAQNFQRIPNRRLIPDYYEVIKEAVAFSTIRTKRLRKQYGAFGEFVRDVALICHNAQVYNRPSSQIFQDATRVRDTFKKELQKLVNDKTVTAEEAALPDLGEIPEAEDSPPSGQVGEDEEDDEDDEEDDMSDDSDEDGSRHQKRGRGARPSVARRRSDRDEESLKRRGGPPKLFTPTKGRIDSLLQTIRKLKTPEDELLVSSFDKLPDKLQVPQFYAVVKNPISMETIKRKHRRRKYQNIDQMVADFDTMTNNAKAYYDENNKIYQHAVELQHQAHLLADHEKAKPDDQFADEDGRRPVPGILHNGETWHVGDWVHMTNPNDPKKPIVAQIFCTWQDQNGNKWINACWYYRPEQTVHRFEKHFYENEAIKTGQYRDHRIEDVIDRCFVMYITKYNKGRPRGFPANKEIYVCESRYNEERHKLSKIKIWASCLPEEVRDKDYDMDLYDHPRRLKKNPSPIKHLLRDDAKPTDPLPKPTWGAPNAPPLVGAVHCRHREANESPPPMPNASPHPSALTYSAGHQPMMQGHIHDSQANNGHVPPSNASQYHPIPVPAPLASTSMGAATYAPAHFAPRPSPTPPVSGLHYGGYSSIQASHSQSQMTPQPSQYQHHQLPQTTQHSSYAVQTPLPQQTQQSSIHNNYGTSYSHTPAPVSHPPSHHVPPHSTHQQPQTITPMSSYDSARIAPTPTRSSMAPGHTSGMHGHSNAHNAPRPIEVFALDDAVNAQIPKEAREQFTRDEQGRILFFTHPPLGRPHSGISSDSVAVGHSLRYLADRARGVQDRRAKRRARDELRKEEELKKRQLEEESRETERKQLVDKASDFLASVVVSMDKENQILMKEWDGWSVKDENIDEVEKAVKAAEV